MHRHRLFLAAILAAMSFISLTEARAAVLPVTNCNNAGAGSLRAAAASAVNLDTIDLRGLACPRITLTSGEITLPQANVTLLGPGALQLIVHGNRASRVINHAGAGTLRLSALTVSYGTWDTGEAIGGCIASTGNVELRNMRVHHCVARGSGGLEPYAQGGGVSAQGNVLLENSSVFENVAESFDALGGGIAAFGRVVLLRSQVYNNRSSDAGGVFARQGIDATYSIIQNNAARQGGGIEAFGPSSINKSTISGNTAFDYCGGLCGGVGRWVIADSTISGNNALRVGGISFFDVTVEFYNSTIAFNREAPAAGGECWGAGIFGGVLIMRSTIVSANTCTIPGGADITGFADLGDRVTGSRNLIGSAMVPIPADTLLIANPRLAALANNGGPTRTHALLADSPAINRGNNLLSRSFDQRGPGFPRVRGIAPDIGAFER